jgi:hypothetical protein
MKCEWMNKYMYKYMTDWMNEWMNEYMNEWINECVLEWFFMVGDSSCPTAHMIIPSHHLWVTKDMCKLGSPDGTTYRHYRHL